MPAHRKGRRSSRPRRARPPIRRRNVQPLNPEAVLDQQRALAALGDMRRKRWSLSSAARANSTTPESVRRFAGSALRRAASGRIRAAAFDRIPRTLSILTPQGSVWVTVRDSRTASKISEHRNAVKQWRRSRDASVLEPFRQRTLRAGGVPYRFVVDPDTLNQLDDADLLALETLYRSVQARSV
jgi:hypothetical protein